MKQLEILIADDDYINYRLLELILSKNLECIIHYANNGLEAWEIAETKDISLALMDVRMPVMNGLEATKRIKAVKPNLPIIAVTAYSLTGHREIVLEAGCDDYITKPIDAWDLLAKIHLQLNK